MEVQVRLQNNYIQVLREENGVKTFGGDQGFFAKTAQADKKEKRKRSSGCGVIALSDMLFYLGRKRKELQIWPSSFYEQKELTEAEYRKWFEEYYTISDAQATIDNVLSQLNNMIPQNGDSPEIPNADLIEKMIDYVKENMKTCMLNAYTDHVSEDDLRTLCEMQKQPSAQAALKASQNMAHNIMSVGMEIIAKYNTWLDSQL